MLCITGNNFELPRRFARIAAIPLLLFVTISISGCSPEEPFEQPEAQRETIVLMHNQARQNVIRSMESSVERFEKANPGYRVVLEQSVNEAYKKTLASAAATNSLPDIFATWSGGTLSEYVRFGLVRNLEPMMIEKGDENRFLNRAIEQVSFVNGIWGVPVENVAIALVFYNKEIFDDLDIAVPRTWDELLSTVDTLNAAGIIPFALANRSAWPSSMYYMYLVDRLSGPEAFSGALAREAARGFDSQPFIKGWSLMQELINRDAFPDETNILDVDIGDSKQMLYDGRAAMELMGSWLVADIGVEHPEFLDRVDFFEFPVLVDGLGDQRNLVGTVGDQFYSVASSSEHPEAAYRMIRHLIDDVAVKQRTEALLIPPLKGVTPSHPLLRRILDLSNNAPSIQLWYDQALPPKLAEKHKEICRQVLDGLSPLEAAKAMENAAVLFYAKQ